MRTKLSVAIALAGALLATFLVSGSAQATSVPVLKGDATSGIVTLVGRGGRHGGGHYGHRGGGRHYGHRGGRYYGHRGGGRYYGRGHHGGHWYRGRWWGYGVGTCWRWTPAGYVWICGY